MMSSTRCDCPELQPVESVPSEPIRCGCCGSPLEPTCARAGGKKHVGRAIRNSGRRPLAAEGAKLRRPHQWSTKLCARCGETFQPTGGRDSLCTECKRIRALEALGPRV